MIIVVLHSFGAGCCSERGYSVTWYHYPLHMVMIGTLYPGHTLSLCTLLLCVSCVRASSCGLPTFLQNIRSKLPSVRVVILCFCRHALFLPRCFWCNVGYFRIYHNLCCKWYSATLSFSSAQPHVSLSHLFHLPYLNYQNVWELKLRTARNNWRSSMCQFHFLIALWKDDTYIASRLSDILSTHLADTIQRITNDSLCYKY